VKEVGNKEAEVETMKIVAMDVDEQQEGEA
jgi:hypothetical protein